MYEKHEKHEKHEKYEKPLPVIDPTTRPFWEATKAHRLTIQRCQDCQTHIFFPRGNCTSCFSDRLEWIEASGEGVIYSYTIARRPAGPAFKEDTPYAIALIDLKEGPRMLSNIVTEDIESIKIGQKVHVIFDDVTEEITLPKFVPVGN